MKIQKFEAKQAHPFPKSIMTPQGPFPRELFTEKPVLDNYEPEMAEDGKNFPSGATAQNNYRSPRIMVCSNCEERVLENKTGDHVCGA